MFRAAVANDSVFSHADDMRHALDEVAEYDAFCDSFLVLPTLQSMYVSWFWLVCCRLLMYLWVKMIID